MPIPFSFHDIEKEAEAISRDNCDEAWSIRLLRATIPMTRRDFDKWQVAYRVLGAHTECGRDERNAQEEETTGGCTRWMIWAAYGNAEYKGNGSKSSSSRAQVDCGEMGSEWEILGLYRQELHGFIDSISKRHWFRDEIAYVVVRATLAYLNKYGACVEVGVVSINDAGDPIYAAVAPQQDGEIALKLYRDANCLDLDNSYESTINELDLSPVAIDESEFISIHDELPEHQQSLWDRAQEPNLILFNEFFAAQKSCNLCRTFPSYEYGQRLDYEIDDERLINQCRELSTQVCGKECYLTALDHGTILPAIFNADYSEIKEQIERNTPLTESPAPKQQHMNSNNKEILILATILVAAALLAVLGTFVVWRRKRALSVAFESEHNNNEKVEMAALSDSSLTVSATLD